MTCIPVNARTPRHAFARLFVSVASFALLSLHVASAGQIEVLRPQRASDPLRAQYSVARPAVRGFRASLFGKETWPIELGAWDANDPRNKAAEIVAKRLAADGLLPTLALAIDALGAAAFALDDAASRAIANDALKAVGVPVDWLDHFSLGATEPPVAIAIARRLVAGEKPADLAAWLATATFAFRPSVPGFRIATDCGEEEAGVLRLQLSSGSYFAAPGDGGCIDLVHQLAERFPATSIVASIDEKHLDAFLATAQGWNLGALERFVVIPEPSPVAQWAQDNGKPGIVTSEGASARVLTLAPRYASRGEEGAIFVPGETFALESFAAAGHEVAQSPLLFQGGDLLAVRDPKTGQRALVMGEAEMHRNVGLGLTREQVLAAFRGEFGVDRCVVLPAVSFHVDFEVSARVHAGELVMFVNDVAAAVRAVLGCGITALERARRLDTAGARAARNALEEGQPHAFLDIAGASISSESRGFGRFSEALAADFSTGPADSGVGNLQRFLLAMDIVAAHAPGTETLGIDPHSSAYLRSFRRQEADRVVLVQGLERMGWKVVLVPSFSEQERGINYLNGVHLPGEYWMPAYGGLYEPLDRAAQQAFEGALGSSVKIVPVLCAETQRRAGALHCAVSISPRPR